MHGPSATVFCSQPSMGSPLQSAQPWLQTPSVQELFSQTAWPFAGGSQKLLQRPQFWVSLWRSTQNWLQQEKPGWQGWMPEQPGMQTAFTQMEPCAQSVSITQPTQALIETSHTVPGAQSVLSAQPTWHLFWGVQNCCVGQMSFSGVQGTQSPVARSQTAPGHSASLMQPGSEVVVVPPAPPVVEAVEPPVPPVMVAVVVSPPAPPVAEVLPDPDPEQAALKTARSAVNARGSVRAKKLSRSEKAKVGRAVGGMHASVSNFCRAGRGD